MSTSWKHLVAAAPVAQPAVLLISTVDSAALWFYGNGSSNLGVNQFPPFFTVAPASGKYRLISEAGASRPLNPACLPPAIRLYHMQKAPFRSRR